MTKECESYILPRLYRTFMPTADVMSFSFFSILTAGLGLINAYNRSLLPYYIVWDNTRLKVTMVTRAHVVFKRIIRLSRMLLSVSESRSKGYTGSTKVPFSLTS